HYGRQLTSRAISDLVYRTEIIFHGTPSGIDNTVVAFERPVYFVKGQRRDVIWVGKPFSLVIGDTGVPSKTRDVVEDVRRVWLSDRSYCKTLFGSIGGLVDAAKEALVAGEMHRLGQLMDANQHLLAELGVSSPELDRLITAAREAGALGAKLSGGGRGGCMIALVDEKPERVASALLMAGAASVMTTSIH
ncbi:MAG: mevalonate kinase, partial [Chloroflexi bacterium RBG_13_56_8]